MCILLQCRQTGITYVFVQQTHPIPHIIGTVFHFVQQELRERGTVRFQFLKPLLQEDK